MQVNEVEVPNHDDIEMHGAVQVGQHQSKEDLDTLF